VLCFGFTCLKDGFTVKKLLTLAALFAFVVVLGCNDTKSSSTSKTTIEKTETKKDPTK
jgi:hypothetical protein